MSNRAVKRITDLFVRKYEPAGFLDYDLAEQDDATTPLGGEVVEVSPDDNTPFEVGTEVYRVSWAEKPKVLVLGGSVHTDNKRKPVRRGTVSVPQGKLPMVADRAKPELSVIERELWLHQFPTVGAPPKISDASARILLDVSRRIIDGMMGSDFIIDDGGRTVSILA